MYGYRKAYLETRSAAIQIQSGWRARAAKELFMELKAKNKAACQLQASYRAYVARRRFQEVINATIYVQRWWRRAKLQRKIEGCVAAWEAETQKEQEIAQARERERRIEEEKVQNDFNLLQKEFNMDSAQIRHVLQLYSEGLLVPVSSLPEPQEPDDKALQELQRINVQLQKEVDDLKDENALLLELRKASEAQAENRHPRIVSITAAAHGSEPSSPVGSLGSVSIMSYSDTEPESAQKIIRPSRDGQMSFGRAGPTGAVAALNAELEKKGSLFDDDAAFIKEVHEGVSYAPSMDPDFEIRRLLVRYKTWHREFKARLRSTQQSLRKAPASPEASLHSSSRKDNDKKQENKLSNKLRSLSKVARLGK
jgi:myosin-5